MARRGEKRVWAFSEASDPGGLVALMRLWIESLRVRGISANTVAALPSGKSPASFSGVTNVAS